MSQQATTTSSLTFYLIQSGALIIKKQKKFIDILLNAIRHAYSFIVTINKPPPEDNTAVTQPCLRMTLGSIIPGWRNNAQKYF
jgi:hypothetical protein